MSCTQTAMMRKIILFYVCFPAKKLFQTGLWKEEVHQASFLPFGHRRADRLLSSFITQIAPQLRRVWDNINETITVSICVSLSLGKPFFPNAMDCETVLLECGHLHFRNRCQQPPPLNLMICPFRHYFSSNSFLGCSLFLSPLYPKLSSSSNLFPNTYTKT